ncbi:hypothetical protein N7457_000667 [Penicillium paradoxum]|uniref:uncharacterized protein n=1 Tax=Penicillium paradoxum TaxID=176176 RepID=UPI002547F6E8|nr:uncharacterized protein N7457_000667 [Penicillium paradoxum]KAJ5794068.1 hypothetical protein N7457_000667 [Penicillium paradoxum]
MRFGTHIVLASLTCFLTGSEALSIAARNTTEAGDACFQIHERFVDHSGKNAEQPFKVSGELALKCLRAMPFKKEPAVSFVKEFRKYLQFQSTIEILKSPPPDYPMPPVDLLGGLDKIQEKAAAGEYANQFDFDAAIQLLLNSAYEGHLSAGLCSHQQFNFEKETPLVSISSDGIALPEVYTYKDSLHLQSKDSTVSPIVSINDVDVVDYLNNLARSSQDWDALFNSMLFSNSQSLAVFGVTGKISTGFTLSTTWPGPYHSLHFANGSTSVIKTVVTVSKFPYKNGATLYETLCAPSNDTSSDSSDGSKEDPDLLEAPSGYPEPFIKDDYNRILGFFPSSKGLEDTSVLVIPTFDPTAPSEQEGSLPNSGEVRFADVAREFIHNSTIRGKKRMIIDVSGNGGGLVSAGLNMFKMFFPDQDIYQAARFRAHETVDLMGQVVSTLPLDQAPDSPVNWRIQVKPDQESGFKSWEDYYGPEDVFGVSSSHVMASNLSMTSTSTEPIGGYGVTQLDPQKPAFAAEDIILLTDGICASTCTIFSELMKAQGRPRNTPMQGMGGTKGSQVYELVEIAKQAAQVDEIIRKAANSSTPILHADDMAHYRKIFPIPLDDFPLKLKTGSVNILSAFSSETDPIPRQFKYEAAECRRFLTLDNILKPETMWASAADAMFHGGDCVPGSTNSTRSLRPKLHSRTSGPKRCLGPYCH